MADHVGRPAVDRSLHRALGLWHVAASGIGVILGAGVYALIGPAAGYAGGALWLAFVVAGAAAAMTAYAYARLGAMRPKASPEYQYTALGFGPRAGFVAGWLMLVADLAATAAVAIGFGGYLAHLAGTPPVAGALVIVVVAAGALYAGVTRSVALAIALTVVEAAGLLFVIAVGVPHWPAPDWSTAAPVGGGLSTAAALIFFAYLGFDELGNLAEEMRRPERDLPRALGISLVVTTLIYVAVALSATAVVAPAALADSPAPLALVARSVLGPAADRAMSLMALAATANTVVLLLLSASRSIYGMAGEGVLPRRLARVGVTRVPVPATVVATLAAGALVLAGDLTAIARLTDAAVLVSFGLVNASCVWLASRGRTAGGRGRRVLDVAVPAAGAALCLWLLGHAGWVALAGTVLLGVLGLALLRPR